MDIKRILGDLRAERSRLDQAIAALEALGKGTGTAVHLGRAAQAAAAKPARRRRHMSAAARKRISAMMKARWAERKKKAGKTA
jgi:hypothetical protein